MMTNKDYTKLIDSWDTFELLLHQLNSNHSLLPEFMKFALHNEHPNGWRALYFVDKIYEKHPDWILPYFPEIIDRLKSETHHGKKRHLLRLISFHEIQAEDSGFLVDYCLGIFTSQKEPVANRVHAMQILYNISENEPDLKPELLESIQQQLEFHPTPGIRSRGLKLSKKLFQQINQTKN